MLSNIWSSLQHCFRLTPKCIVYLHTAVTRLGMLHPKWCPVTVQASTKMMQPASQAGETFEASRPCARCDTHCAAGIHTTYWSRRHLHLMHTYQVQWAWSTDLTWYSNNGFRFGMSSLSSVLAGRVIAADTKAPSSLLSCSTARKASTMLLLTPPADSNRSSKLPCEELSQSALSGSNTSAGGKQA